MKYLTTIIILVVGVFSAATVAAQGDPCTQEPEIMTTDDGVEFVRTPDACFENLPDWPYEPHYVEIDGLRQAYVDFGSGESGETILLLHGQPSWSYLYRKMIPVLAEEGHRVISMDHLGMGRSDKPIDPDYYTYLGHTERLEAFIQELELEQDNLTIFVQDWGSLIGLYVVGTNPDWFDRVVVGNGFLPPLQEGQNAFEYPEDIEASNAVFHENLLNSPAQQPPIRDEDGNLLVEQYGGAEAGFGAWAAYARYSEDFMPSLIVEASTYFPLTDEEEAAYDAPFPSRITMGGPRAFPSLANQLGGVTMPAFMGLMQYDRPLLTIWGNNDQGNLGDPQLQQTLIERVPGAAGWDHIRLQEASHFLQDDQGEEIARRVNEFIAQSSGETAVSGETVQMYGVEVSVLDRGARWLATGIEEIDAVEGLSELDRATLHTHLVTLIENSGLRHDEAYHADFVSELEAQEFLAEAIEIVERAFVRVSSPLNYHEGYWVSETEVEGVPVPVTMINDIHIDAYAGTVTVYGQVQVLGNIIAPVQAGPGEVVEHFSGNMLGMHPNAVYLNGSGEELAEADGTGSWWVKHPIMGPEGYYNWPALISDYSSGGQYTEGYLLEDGVTMMLRSFFEDNIRGFPVDNEAIADEFYGNLGFP